MLYVWKRNTCTLVQTHSLAEWYGLSVGARLIHCCHGNPLKKDGEATVKSDTFSLSRTLFFYSCEIFSSCPILTSCFFLSCCHSIALPPSLSVFPSKSLALGEYCLLSSRMSIASIHSFSPASSSSLRSAQCEYVTLPPTPHHISFCLRRELYLVCNRFPGLYPRSSQPLVLAPCIFYSLLLPPSICTFLWTGACLGTRVLSN